MKKNWRVILMITLLIFAALACDGGGGGGGGGNSTPIPYLAGTVIVVPQDTPTGIPLENFTN